MRKCAHRCRVSKPITACSVTRWVSTPHGMKCPQRTKAVSAARPLERGYQQPTKFFDGTYPTESLKFLVKDVAERLAGVEGGTPVFRLETGFGGGKTHSLIALVHVAREGDRIAELVAAYGITHFPSSGETRIAAFVGDVSDPFTGIECE